MGATAGILALTAGGIQAIGAIQSAQAQAAAANYNRAIAEWNASIARQQTEADLIALRKTQYKQLGALRAAVGASGVTMEGSPLDVLEDSVTEAELDIQRLRYSGEIKAQGFELDATLYGMQAESAKTAGYFSAAGYLTAGMADYYGYPAPKQGTPVQVAGTTR